MHSQSNKEWVENRLKFIELRNHQDGLEKYANSNGIEALTIRRQLNIYELIAIGIKNDILDEEMYKHYYKSTVVRDFKGSRNFVDRERKGVDGTQTFWVEFEEMAKRFEA